MSSEQQEQQSLIFRECASELSMSTLNDYFNENLYDNFGICIAEIRRKEYSEFFGDINISQYDFFYVNEENIKSLAGTTTSKQKQMLQDLNTNIQNVLTLIINTKNLKEFSEQIQNVESRKDEFF